MDDEDEVDGGDEDEYWAEDCARTVRYEYELETERALEKETTEEVELHRFNEGCPTLEGEEHPYKSTSVGEERKSSLCVIFGLPLDTNIG